MQLDGLNGNPNGSALQPSEQTSVRAVLLPGDLQRRPGEQKAQHSQQIRLTLTGTPVTQNGGEGEVEVGIGKSQRVSVGRGLGRPDRLPQGGKVVQVKLSAANRHQPALEHRLVVNQLRCLPTVLHGGGRGIPSLRDEGSASTPAAPFEQTVLTHRLQCPAHGDLADVKCLRDHAGIDEPLAGREISEPDFERDSGTDQSSSGQATEDMTQAGTGLTVRQQKARRVAHDVCTELACMPSHAHTIARRTGH